MADLCVVLCVAFDHRADAERLEHFKACICECSFVELTMDVSGGFDMIVHAKMATLADYTDQMTRIRPQIAEFVERIEANFVGRKVERHSAIEQYLWVPCVGGRRRIDIGKIDKVIADGDYMRLHIEGWHCLLHSTITAIKDQLGDRFIQLHRSSIVRIDFLDRIMRHERRWIAHLKDGSKQPIAKSHVSEVLDLIASDSSKVGSSPAKSEIAIEESPPPNEMLMQMTH